MNLLKTIALFCLAGAAFCLTPVLPVKSSVVSAVQSLAPNTGMYLPAFTCTDVYNGSGLAIYETFAAKGPGVRNYCTKWVWAPDRKRALYAGANHGAPHKFNDVWEYDLASNTWVMLYKGDGSVPCHTWWNFAYDTKRDTLWWPSAGGCGNWVDWHRFDPEARDGWSVASFANSAPTICAGGMFHYIPDRDIFVYMCADWMGPGMWEYNPNTRRFTLIAGDSVYFDPDCCPKTEAVFNYDTHLRILVGFRGGNVFHYNFDTHEWKLAATGPFNAYDAFTACAFDTAAGLHLILDNGTLYGYDAATKTVRTLTPQGQQPWTGDYMGYYDEQYQVFVVYHGNLGNPTPWVYRAPATSSAIARRAAVRAGEIGLFPSPVARGGSVRVDCRGMENVGVYAPDGRRIAVIAPGAAWKADVPAGVYLVRGMMGTQTRSRRLVVMN